MPENPRTRSSSTRWSPPASAPGWRCWRSASASSRPRGLFETDRKRPIPFLPRVIGVVTSPTGAVIRDILHRLEDRFPRPVLVWPVRVQGEGGGGGRNRRGDPGLQRPVARWPDSAAGRADRRPRRRLDRGSLGLQRGGGGARRRRVRDPADLGGRPRDRYDADRFCLRPPRPDADERGRDGGAGAGRTQRPGP
ncbi:protein of unknown function [Methylorubrum extorquens]|uniref:Exonuclease VII large subunit C-terminal domain-containing protein n=1 Tax=Methylorubrum extorquens TaxID=408 RepID=A0A2N9ALV6_METEX|nr:protein of unknown function [Methylorubrum extorquens]